MKRMAIVSGICCTDVQADQTPGGKSRSRFTVVVNEGTGEKRISTFLPCTAYGQTADFAAKHLAKGKPVEVVGKMNPYTYERDNQKRHGFEILVDSLDFVPGDTKKTTSADTADTDEKEDA